MRDHIDGRPELLAFSGFVPEQICDTVRFFRYPGRQSIAHYCGYAADFISQVLDDPDIDGCVFPRTCDSSRVLESYLAGSGKFVHRLHIPARRDGAAAAYLAAGLRRYKEAVEGHFGIELKDIKQRTVLINERNQALRELYELLPELSYGAYLDTLQAMLQKPLSEQSVPGTLPAGTGGTPVYLVGSTLCQPALAREIEKAGMNIVGDRLTESRRLFSAPPVETDGDLYENIAASMLQNMTSPTQNSFESILREDAEELRRKGVRGVIFVTQKYCEAYDYLYSVYKKMLDELSIPALKLTLTGSTDGRSFDAAIGTFADIL